MLKMNIISKVIIEPISQEYLEELLREAITKQNPEVYVNSFAFTQRRSPACIEVTVDAQLGKPAAIEGEGGIPNITEVTTAADFGGTISETEPEETEQVIETAENISKLEEEGSTKAVDDTKPQSIAEIFGS